MHVAYSVTVDTALTLHFCTWSQFDFSVFSSYIIILFTFIVNS